MIRLLQFSQVVISKSNLFLNKNLLLSTEIKTLLFAICRNYLRLSKGHSGNFIYDTTPSTKLLKHFSNYKKRKNNKQLQKFESSSDDESEGSDTDSEFDENEPDIKAFTTTSLRLDLILKKCLDISRKKVENFFYEKKLRRNGTLLIKKAAEINVGDEIDLIKNISDEKIIVDRIEIIEIKIDSEKEVFMVKSRVLKSVSLGKCENKGLKYSEKSES